MTLDCPKCGTPVEERHMEALNISQGSVTDFSIIPTTVVKVTGREISELRYYYYS